MTPAKPQRLVLLNVGAEIGEVARRVAEDHAIGIITILIGDRDHYGHCAKLGGIKEGGLVIDLLFEVILEFQAEFLALATDPTGAATASNAKGHMVFTPYTAFQALRTTVEGGVARFDDDQLNRAGGLVGLNKPLDIGAVI